MAHPNHFNENSILNTIQNPSVVKNAKTYQHGSTGQNRIVCTPVLGNSVPNDLFPVA